jgi:hypothetical protein
MPDFTDGDPDCQPTGRKLQDISFYQRQDAQAGARS